MLCTSCSTCNGVLGWHVHYSAVKDHAKPLLAGLAILPLLASVAFAHGQAKPAAKPVAYAPVEKIIKAKCVGCHQGAAPAGGVNLSSYDMVVKGKYKGKPLVVAKKPADSVLAKGVHGSGVQKMPPGGSFPPNEVKTIDDWIAAGAKK